jgi:crotonobetainyl-CoA:carnitine CoA-transferase CaiB-like acyl-CoA transferase
MTSLLQGVRIADFSHVMAGPYASHLLRLMGAEVIKIEPLVGDAFRNYGADRRYDGMSPAFIAANAGKKSIALDLKDPGDADIARRIVAKSDVLLENFRPGVITRLGFGYEHVRALNPEIIYCSVSGYGQDGEQRDWPAIDNIVQATSGMMMLSGGPDDPPIRIGFPIVDTVTGQTAAIAILGALLRRANGGGGGSHIDVAMFDAALAFMTSTVTPYLVTGQPMPRMGNTGYSGLPTASLFAARDGRLVSLGVVQANQFAALCQQVGRPDWLDDPRFATPDARRANFAAMTDELAVAMKKRDAADWESRLAAAGVPCGMVRSVDEAVELSRDGSILDLKVDGLPNGNAIAIPGLGFRLDNDQPDIGDAPPRLDADRDEILDWLAGQAN